MLYDIANVVVFLISVTASQEHWIDASCHTQLECVCQFRHAFKLKVAGEPQHDVFRKNPPEVESCTLLIFEELRELERGIEEKSLYAVTDAIVDAQYVLNAAAACFGLSLDEEIQSRHGTGMTELKFAPKPQQHIFDENPGDVQRRMNAITKQKVALQVNIQNKNFGSMTDALADIWYELFSASALFGIDLDRAFGIVHRANMAKLCRSEEQAEDTVRWYLGNSDRYKSPRWETDGTYWRVSDEDQAKPLKCIGWTEPDFSPLGIEPLTPRSEL